MTKEKLALFDAIFVAPNYAEHKVTVMVSILQHYSNHFYIIPIFSLLQLANMHH